jgi:two-component system chemotaxis sensor kinase CheA
VIEEIADPLTHMIRNSMDHGIETPAERVAAGKPAEGTIQLTASHRGGRIVIAVEDDGRGINREKVLRLARERGLVAPTAQLSDEEIDNLIFAAGFSTADEVTDISGRGVGMDVVRRNIQALGGRVTIQSTPGKGSRFTLTLPLTLAVLDGMILSVGAERYILPINSIVESLRPRAQDLHRLPNGESVVSIRGDYVRLVHLGSIFDVTDAVVDASAGLVVLVDTEDRGRIGLVIDELLGQQQVVIKSLEENYDQIEGISAATILGNGRVALILDVDGLARMRVAAGIPHGRESAPLDQAAA